MSEVFHALRFGPFSTAYHRELVDDAFKGAARHFLSTQLLPQVDHDIIEIDGTLLARSNEDRNCGPNSAVRNCFLLDLRIFGTHDHSEINTQLWYRPGIGEFQVARGASLYLWTPRRRERREAEKEAIQKTVDRILSHSVETPRCPVCQCVLQVTNTSALFEAVCPRLCFRYHFHKDQNGRLLHGHFAVPSLPPVDSSRSRAPTR